MICYDVYDDEEQENFNIPTEEEEEMNYVSYKRGRYTVVVKNEISAEENSIVGNNIVFTGRGPFSRGTLMDLARKCGCYISSNSITRDTNLLVVGEKPGSKLRKAQMDGIKIIPMENFISEVNIIMDKIKYK